jgi:hypothetical protein
MLLELFQKNLVHIVQRRLNRILVNKNILKSLNFAELEGKSIAVLIHILYNLIEDTKQQKKEM